MSTSAKLVGGMVGLVFGIVVGRLLMGPRTALAATGPNAPRTPTMDVTIGQAQIETPPPAAPADTSQPLDPRITCAQWFGLSDAARAAWVLQYGEQVPQVIWTTWQVGGISRKEALDNWCNAVPGAYHILAS